MKIKIINGANPNDCKCGNWLNHWKNFSGKQLPDLCPENKCIEKPEIGVLCQKADTTLVLADPTVDDNWYVAPLCRKHSSSVEPIEIFITLVPANACNPVGKDDDEKRLPVAK